jgi:uncharacterized oligopeptide transporter (OPT) family protein
VLSVSNIYAGLKLGIVPNMALTVILLSYGLWTPLSWLTRGGVRRFGMLENNIAQTTGSAAALVASAGLVGPLPALAIVAQVQPGWGTLALWIVSVCLVGIVVAVAIRHQMVVHENLRFAHGVVCAETLREIHTRGTEATRRVLAFLCGALGGCGVKLTEYVLSRGRSATGLQSAWQVAELHTQGTHLRL